MFKKFMCLALSLMMVLSTVSVTGFAADYERDGLVASNVTFTEDGKKAAIDVENTGDEAEKVVFWLGEYLNNVLVKSDFEVVEIEAGTTAEDITAELASTNENSVMKAYIWKDSVGGRAIAPVATYLSDDASVNYITQITKDENGNIISEEVVDIEFTEKEDGTFEHNIVLERTNFDIPQFKFYAKDNSAVVDEPETYVVGANTVTITTVEAPEPEETPVETPAESPAPEGGEATEGEEITDTGVSETYVINISYKAPEFKNFSSANNSIEKTEIRLVPAEACTLQNYTEERMKGSSAYVGYPGKTSTGALNNFPVTSYMKTLGHNEGEFYVFRTTKGPSNSSAWYQGGVGKYDGTTGEYFLSFDLEASGTMYLMLREGQKDAHIKNFVREGFVPHPKDAKVYYKHFDAGETVEVPSMGWDDSFHVEARPTRAFMDSTYFMFGYDSEGYAVPSPIDEDNADLKELAYIANGQTSYIDLTDANEYTVEVPTGTKEVIIRAKKSEPFAGITYAPKTVTVKRGETVSSVITVTSYDSTATRTYTVNINEAVPNAEDAKNANLASLKYTVDGQEYELDVNDEDKTYTIEVPYKTKEVSASAAPELSYVDVAVEPATAEIADGKATIVVTATAYDGTEAVYTINFEEDLPEGEDASDTALKALTYTIGTEVNTIEITGESEYAVEVPYGTKEVIVAAEANYYSDVAINAADGKVAITESTLEDGTVVKEGKATVTVTAYDGTTAEYTVTFTPAPPAEDDATLGYLGYTIGEGEAVAIELFEGVTDYYITLPAGTTADAVGLVAEPNVSVEEGVVVSEAVMPEAWDANNQGTASVSVTAMDGETTLTYTVVFTAEIEFSKRSNKIYALTSYIGDKIKTENNAYMTEEEAAGSGSAMAIGENLDKSTIRNYNKTDRLYSPSDDMLGASYIRTQRYYGNAGQTITTDGTGIIKRTYAADGTYTDKTGTSFGSGAGANQIRIFNLPEQKFFGGSDGWISFEVTDDCIVVVGDWTGFDGEEEPVSQWRYPTINPNVTADSGWSVSDGTTNYIGGTSFYKEFKAGDKVVLPNYGLASVLSDTSKVEYIYNGGTITETDVAHTTMSWEGVSVAVKWTDTSVSSNAAIASIKLDGTEIDMASAVDGKYSVMAPSADTDTVTLEVTAADENAFVVAPATIKVGQTVEIVVRAASGDSKTYYVELVKRDVTSTKLVSLDYKIGDGDWTVVEGFEPESDVRDFAIPAIEYVLGGQTEITVRAITEVGEHEFTGAGTLVYGTPLSIPVEVVSEDATATDKYTVAFEMAEKVFGIKVEATDEFKALFADGKYTGGHVIKADSAPTYATGTQYIASWDEDGNARHVTYTLTVDGEAYADGKEFTYAEAIAIRDSLKDNSTVIMTSTGKYNYSSSKFTTEFSSSFNTSGHHFGPVGSAFRNADFQIMTHREIAPGRVNSATTYKDVAATKTWLRTDSNYLFTVTPNSKATVYVAFNTGYAKDHAQYIADGWTLIDSSSYYTAATLNALPDEAIIDGYETLPAKLSREWYMVEPSYIINEAPYSLVKIQYDTGSGTQSRTYPYVWYKTVEEGETLYVPTVGDCVSASDQNPIKAFVIEGAHEGWEPAKSDNATLSSLKIGGKEVDLKASEYSVTLPYGTTKAAIEAVTAHSGADYTPKGEVDVTNGSVITITVTAEDGETTKEYKINVSVSTEPEKSDDATLKSLSYAIDGALKGDIALVENVFEYEITVPSNADAVKLTAEKNDSKAGDPVVADADLSGSAPAATVTVTAENGTQKVYTVNVKKASVPFVNITSADSFIKESSTFKVYNAADENVKAATYLTDDEAERTAKIAEYQAQINAVNAKYGTNAARGTSVWGTYPSAGNHVVSNVVVGAKLDNPMAFGSYAKDADYIIDGDSWVFKSTKGYTPTATNQWSFGKNDEFLTFEVSKPGTMYVIDANSWGYKGGTDNGYTLVNGYTLGGCAVYEKHFEAGKVTVPAQDTDKYTIGTRQSNTIGFVFMFDDLSNADLTSISYKAGNNEGKIAVSADTTEYEVEILPYTGAVEVTGEAVMAGTKVEAEGTVTDGAGTVIVTATAPDGETTKEYTLVFKQCEPYKIVNATKAAGAAWVDGFYGDATKNFGTAYAVDDAPLTLGTTYRYSDRTGEKDKLGGATTSNLSGATYIRTPKNEGAAEGVGNVRAYGDSYSIKVGDKEPETWTTKHNDAQVEGNIGFRTVTKGSWEKAFFSGAYDGKEGNPYWVTFVPTSDCTVIIGDNVFLDNLGGHDANGGYPNLDKTLWKNNTEYALHAEAARTYVRHFKAGEKVEIPNYGLSAQHKDATPVVFTYTDANGATQTYESTVRDLALNWEDITIAVVWDDKSVVSNAQSIEVNGELIEGFKADVYEYEYILANADDEVELTATYDAAATAEGLGTYKDGDTATVVITAGDGTTKSTYTIKFTFPKTSADATLNSLMYTVEGDTEAKAIADFAADKTEYTVAIPYSAELADITVAATANDENASVAIKQADVANGKMVATVAVTAEDGTTKKTYTVEFVISSDLDKVVYTIDGKADEYSVSKLTVKNGEPFYSIELASGTKTIEFVNNSADVTYNPSGSIALAAEGTKVVTATVGGNVYTIKVVTKIKYDGMEDGGEFSDSTAVLKNISYTYSGGNGEVTTPTTEGGETYYYIEVASEVDRITVTANPADATSQGASETVSLTPGETTTVTLKVTLADGTEVSYTVKIKRLLVTEIVGGEDGGEV